MIKGRNIDGEVLVFHNRTAFDLSGSAANEMCFYNKNHPIQINKVWIKYEEATSADAGVAINIGNDSAGAEYFTDTSDVSKSAGDVVEYGTGDCVLATIPKDTLVYINHAGGKTGTGTAYVTVAYTVL